MMHSFFRGSPSRFALVLALLCLPQNFSATLVWNPNPEKDLGGYFVYVSSPDQDLFFRTDVQLAPSLDLSFTLPGQSYTFFVTAYNRAGIESDPSESVTYDVPVPLGWPSILIQPSDLSVPSGAIESFYVQPSGTNVTIQWLKDGVELAGKTNALLLFAPVTESDAGRYSARVGNALGTVESRKARLDVLVPPRIVAQSRHVNVPEGTPVELSVEVAGSPPLTFTWMRETNILEEFAGPWFFLPEARAADSGIYFVEIRNEFGSVVSEPIELLVQTAGEPPQLQISKAAEGFSVQVYGTPGSVYDIEQASSPAGDEWIPLRTVTLDTAGFAFFEFYGDTTATFIRARARPPE